ncbi:MAG: substrate-binding domain-containing protein [Prevotellaceae bacterium]|jgi:phosphate transport system substrate-binding protein|nr:substrate-binding domain-containing protein [Prevotellaceae bacterium]
MKKTVFVSLMLFCLIACEQQPQSEEIVDMSDITIENYPRFDASTSTHPLNQIIAAKLLGLEYEFYKGMGVVISDASGSVLSEKLQCSQTHSAIINLIDNQTDIITVARKMSADERNYAQEKRAVLIETPIALDALDFIVNIQNPVNSLTLSEIQNIYLGNITNWSAVGGTNDNIVPFIRNANSGSQEMMNEFVMNNVEMSDWEVSYTDELTVLSMLQVYSELRQNPNGICFTPHYYKEYLVMEDYNEIIKTLAVNNIMSGTNSIKNKTYPIIAPVYVMIRSDLDKNSMTCKLYEWLQTTAGKAVIEESGYVAN